MTRIYHCDLCQFTTPRQSHFERHIKTKKHLIAHGMHLECIQCECGKEFTCRQNLRRHKQTCGLTPEKPETETITPEFILQLVHENKELKQMLIQQHTELLSQYKETQSQIMEYCKQPTQVKHNHTFNLNLFLNVHCKDAVNLSDFIRDLEVQASETEAFGKLGFVEGITRIVMNRMSYLGLHKRPIHCTDIKREVIYIKDEDKWDKDVENAKTKQLIEKIQLRNLRTLNAVVPPESFVLDAPDYNKKCAIIRNTAGGMTTYECEKNHEKILHLLTKELFLEKREGILF
jgi:hypothetical protein